MTLYDALLLGYSIIYIRVLRTGIWATDVIFVQLLCFGVQWTPGVEDFMETCMNRPLLYISDPLEASVFGQVCSLIFELGDGGGANRPLPSDGGVEELHGWRPNSRATLQGLDYFWTSLND